MTPRSSYWSLDRRRINRRKLLQGTAAGGVGVAGLALVGCGDDDDEDVTPTSAGSTGGSTPAASPTEAVAQPVSGGTWRERSVAAPSAWDPYINLSYSAQQHWGHMTNRVLRYAYGPEYLPLDLTLAPDLAASMPEQPDPLTVVVKLREGVKFHDVAPTNGRLLTAEDVAWSIDRYKALGAQKGAYGGVTSMDVTDDNTLTIHLDRQTASFIAKLGDGTLAWILAKEAAGDTEMGPTSTFVGTGPYIFEKYDTEVQMSFNRNPDFFEGSGKPYIDRVETAIIPEDATADAQFRAGQLSYATIPDRDRLADLQKIAGVQSITYPASAMQMKEFSPHAPPFDNPDVRRAVCLAIDRDEYPAALGAIDYQLNTHAFPASYTPFYLDPRSEDFGENAKWFTYEPAEAKAMLAAAGYDDSNPLEFTHTYTPQYAGYQTIAELMADQLSKIGVKMALKSYPYTEWQQRFKVATGAEWRTWIGMMANAPATFPDPSTYFITYWLGEANRNMANFSDPELTRQYEEQDKELDLEKRVALLQETQRYMALQSRAVTIHSNHEGTLWPGTLRNVFPRLSYGRGSEMVAQVWYDKS